MRNVYGYGRVSTRNQKDKMTRADQEDACLSFFVADLEPLGCTYAGFTFDEAESGGIAFGERTGGRTLYHKMERGDVLVCYDHSRLSRDTDDWVPMRSDFKQRGILIKFVHDPFSSVSSPAVQKYGRDHLIAAATFMREQKSEECVARNVEKRLRGVPVSHVAAPGWKIVGTGISRRYRVDEHERGIINIMASLREEGMTHFQIGRYMDRRSTKQRLKPKRYRSFTDERHVRWALRARLLDYPKDITSRKEFEKQWHTLKASLQVSGTV
jgi:DNA invertase Pin-like site-specific DNA recombinase